MRHTAPRRPRFDSEWHEMINLLPSHRRAAMEEAIRRYQIDAVRPSGLDGAELMAFLLIKKIVDKRARQREARRLRKDKAKALSQSVSALTSPEEAPAPSMPSAPSKPDTAHKDTSDDHLTVSHHMPQIDDEGYVLVRSMDDMVTLIDLERQGYKFPKLRYVDSS